MGILAWIVVGLVSGWLAGEVMRGDGFGLVGNMIVGIIGALVGGFLAATLLGVADPLTGINVTTIIVSFLGAVVTLAVLGAARRVA